MGVLQLEGLYDLVQSRWFLECAEDNFLTQVISETTWDNSLPPKIAPGHDGQIEVCYSHCELLNLARRQQGKHNCCLWMERDCLQMAVVTEGQWFQAREEQI